MNSIIRKVKKKKTIKRTIKLIVKSKFAMMKGLVKRHPVDFSVCDVKPIDHSLI